MRTSRGSVGLPGGGWSAATAVLFLGLLLPVLQRCPEVRAGAVQMTSEQEADGVMGMDDARRAAEKADGYRGI